MEAAAGNEHQAITSAIGDRPRVTHLHGAYPVGPLGRAIHEAGGQPLSVDAAGRGVVVVARTGAGSAHELPGGRQGGQLRAGRGTTAWWVLVAVLSSIALAATLVSMRQGAAADDNHMSARAAESGARAVGSTTAVRPAGGGARGDARRRHGRSRQAHASMRSRGARGVGRPDVAHRRRPRRPAVDRREQVAIVDSATASRRSPAPQPAPAPSTTSNAPVDLVPIY